MKKRLEGLYCFGKKVLKGHAKRKRTKAWKNLVDATRKLIDSYRRK